MATETFYVLELRAEGCVAEFFLNDVPVIRRGDGDGLGRELNGPHNHLLRPGRNELSVVIRPGPRPSEALTGPGGRRRWAPLAMASATARLAAYPFGAVVGGPSARPLIELEWHSPDDGELRPWPQVIGGAADLGPLWGPPVWAEAPQLTLDGRTRAEVHGFLSDLHQALERHDWEAFFAASRPRLAQIERAYQLPGGSKEGHARKVFQADATREGFGFVAPDSDSYDLRLCGDGRLIECVGLDWQPLLKENPLGDDGAQSQYDMFLAKLDGAWAIVA